MLTLKGLRKTLRQITVQISTQFNLDVSGRTVRHHLIYTGPHGRVTIKKPLLSKKHRPSRLPFAKSHLT